jgi:hypothetical protein
MNEFKNRGVKDSTGESDLKHSEVPNGSILKIFFYWNIVEKILTSLPSQSDSLFPKSSDLASFIDHFRPTEGMKGLV